MRWLPTTPRQPRPGDDRPSSIEQVLSKLHIVNHRPPRHYIWCYTIGIRARETVASPSRATTAPAGAVGPAGGRWCLELLGDRPRRWAHPVGREGGGRDRAEDGCRARACYVELGQVRAAWRRRDHCRKGQAYAAWPVQQGLDPRRRDKVQEVVTSLPPAWRPRHAPDRHPPLRIEATNGQEATANQYSRREGREDQAD